MFSLDSNLLRSARFRIDLQHRVLAFVMTTLAVLAGICLLWPISVSKFRSSAEIELVVKATDWDRDRWLPVVAECVRMESSRQRLERLLDQVERSTELRFKPFVDRDYLAIAGSIQMGVRQLRDDDAIRLMIAIDGDGRIDERRFLELFSVAVAERCQTIQSTREGDRETVHVDSRSALDHVDEAMDLTRKLNEQLRHRDESGSSKRNAFQFASSSTRTHQPRDVVPPAGLEVDTLPLQQTLESLKTSIGKSQPGTVVRVATMQGVASTALGATPGTAAMIWISLISVLAGTAVAVSVRPFAETGFQTIDDLERTLEIPVLAKLPRDRGERLTDDGWGTAVGQWANSVADASSTFLLAGLIVTIGFLLIDPAVREAFFQNPFDGLARIIRVFLGY